MAGQTAGPNGLTFFEGSLEYPGGNIDLKTFFWSKVCLRTLVSNSKPELSPNPWCLILNQVCLRTLVSNPKPGLSPNPWCLILNQDGLRTLVSNPKPGLSPNPGV